MTRCITKLLVFVLAGAIINIAVAWAFALAASKEIEGSGLLVKQQFCDGEYDSTIVICCTSGAMIVFDDQFTSKQLASTGLRQLKPSVIDWCRLVDQCEFEMDLEGAMGWPWLGMRWSQRYGQGVEHGIVLSQSSWRAGIGLTDGSSSHKSRMRIVIRPRFASTVLPCAMIWPGFAFNTGFYATILWLMWATPFAIRRSLRIKRGLCPTCAYPIGRSPSCTECGAAVMTVDQA